MTLVVNDKQITTYDPDTPESITNRVASVFKTLPQYVYLEGGFPLKEEVKMIDLLELIRNISTLDFKEVIEKVLFYNPSLKIKEDVLYIWLAENRYVNELLAQPMMADSIKFSLQQNVLDYMDETEFDEYWRFKKGMVAKELTKEIQKIQKRDQQFQGQYKQFARIEEGLLYTPFLPEKVVLNFVFTHPQLSFLELFNSAVVTELVPVIQVQDFIKVFKYETILDDWLYEHEPMMSLRLWSRMDDRKKIEDYIEVKAISYTDNTLIFEASLSTTRSYLSPNSFAERLQQIFKANLKLQTIKEIKVAGMFFFPQRYLDSYVFSDLVMNDKLFSNMMNIDESNKATKKKSKEGQAWLHLRFQHMSTGDITASINQRYTDKADTEIRELTTLYKDYGDLFPVGSPYIRIYVKGTTTKVIENFQNLLSKLLVLYTEQEENIITIYRTLLGDTNFGTVIAPDLPEEKSMTLRRADVASPEVCANNYSRNCTEDRIPFVVKEEELQNYENVIKFPRDKQFEPAIPSDGVQQKYYTCVDPVYKYPGLQINKLENKGDYPFVPCCFKKRMDDPKKSNKLYRHYFYGEPLEDIKQQKKQQDIVTTDKILAVDKFGALPKELKRLLDLIDYKPNHEYIRLGVERNPSSFLHAVMVGLHETSGILEEKDRTERILELRTEMTDERIISLCRQARYDSTTGEIKKDLQNPQVYLDPKLYIPMLERLYNCTIFLFKKDNLVVPRHLQHYYQYKREGDKPVVLIYEHMGSEADHAEYPQCELIIRWKLQSTETQYSFMLNDKLNTGLKKIFDTLVDGFQLNKKVTPITFPLEKKVNKYVVNQVLDNAGKTRQLTMKYKNQTISLLTSPLPPLPVKEGTKKIYKVKVALAKEILEKWGKVSGQVVPDKKIKELMGKLGDVDISIPVEEEDPVENLKVYTELSYRGRTSVLEDYHTKKKYAYFLQEYAKWLFSKYIGDKEVTDQLLEKFAKEKINLISNFIYEPVEKEFVMNGGIMKKGKLVVQTEETRKRLLYALKLYTIRDKKGLEEYSKKQTIPAYYQSIIDFEKRPNELVVQGKGVIRQWLQERGDLYQLHDKVIIGIQRPYFFYNKLIASKIYLAQNTESLKKALAIGKQWQHNKYNEGVEAHESPLIDFTLYKYKNEYLIEKEIIGTNPSRLEILGYKVENKPRYTVLLHI